MSKQKRVSYVESVMIKRGSLDPRRCCTELLDMPPVSSTPPTPGLLSLFYSQAICIKPVNTHLHTLNPASSARAAQKPEARRAHPGHRELVRDGHVLERSKGWKSMGSRDTRQLVRRATRAWRAHPAREISTDAVARVTGELSSINLGDNTNVIDNVLLRIYGQTLLELPLVRAPCKATT